MGRLFKRGTYWKEGTKLNHYSINNFHKMEIYLEIQLLELLLQVLCFHKFNLSVKGMPSFNPLLLTTMQEEENLKELLDSQVGNINHE